MDENKLKAIVEEAVNKAVEPITQRLDDPDTGLKRINDRLDANTTAVMELEKTVKGYGDMYKINKSNIERLDERLSEVEENVNIVSPPELAIQR